MKKKYLQETAYDISGIQLKNEQQEKNAALCDSTREKKMARPYGELNNQTAELAKNAKIS